MRGGVKRQKRPDAPFYVYMLAVERVFLAHELMVRRWNRKRTAEEFGDLLPVDSTEDQAAQAETGAVVNENEDRN
jgi:hypothetical protein